MSSIMVVANWKSNGDLALANTFADALVQLDCGCDLVLCPPNILLSSFDHQKILLGGQDVSATDNGAFTGEVSARMLAEFGVKYAIVGHSERRAYFQEDALTLQNKVRQALALNIQPIFCVGESLEVHDAGQAKDFILEQLRASLESLSVSELQQLIFAYEPIWSIGTGKAAQPDYVNGMHQHIRQWLVAHGVDVINTKILYGGSVTADNAEHFFVKEHIDGALVGGASLKINELLKICACSH